MFFRNHYKVICQAFGNVIEWYDFMLYVYLINVFDSVFFPPRHKAASFCLLWLIFGLSCLMRPLGSYIFGVIADKISSEKAQKYSIFLMGLSSMALALLPGYRHIGWLAVVLLLVIRCLQVGCASAQFTLSMFIMAGKGSEEPVGRSMVVPQLYSTVGILVAGLVMLLNRSWFHIPEAYYWRFAYGLNVLFLFGYYALLRYRYRLPYPVTVSVSKPKGSFTEVLSQWRPMLLLSLSMLLGFSFVYVCVILYLPTYLSSVLHSSQPLDVIALFCCHLVIAASLYFYAKIYDSLSTRVKNSLMLFPLLVLSVYCVLVTDSTDNFWIILCAASLLYAPCSFALMRAMLVIFPEDLRFRCGGIAYNVGIAVSSFSPMALSYFVGKYNMQGFSYFFLFVSLAALPVSILLIRRVQFSLTGKLNLGFQKMTRA
jgi:MFS transporter, MHS family, proline/betaine transporter